MLRSLHPGSLSKNVRRVRQKWMQEYGADHNDGAIRKDLRRVLKVIKSEASVGKKEGGQRKYTKQLRLISTGRTNTAHLPGTCSSVYDTAVLR